MNQETVSGSSDCGSATSESVDPEGLVYTGSIKCTYHWTLTVPIGTIELKQTPKTPFWDLDLLVHPPSGTLCPVTAVVLNDGISGNGSSTGPGSSCTEIKVRMPVYYGNNSMNPGTDNGNDFTVQLSDAGGGSSTFTQAVLLPKAPVWIVVGDSTSSGWNQQSNNFSPTSYKPNDYPHAWPQYSVLQLNSDFNVPSQWQMIYGDCQGTDLCSNFAQGGASTDDMKKNGQGSLAASLLGQQDNSWNVLSYAGGANDIGLMWTLIHYYSHLGGNPPWTDFDKTCPSGLEADLAGMSTAFISDESTIESNLEGILNQALKADPNVRFVDQRYQYVLPPSYSCGPFAKTVIDDLRGAHIAVDADATDGNFVVVDPAKMWNGALSKLQLIWIYGYPHVNLPAQEYDLGPAAAKVVEAKWGGPN